MKINSRPMILAVRLVVGCLLAIGVTLCAQNTLFYSTYGPPPDATNVTFQASGVMAGGFGGGGARLCINGMDIGTILLKACDQDQDGKVTLAELENTADTFFKLWDTNADGELSTNELAAGLHELFPAPPPGARAVAVVNGVAMQVPVGEMPTPDQVTTANIMADADANNDGQISLQELNDWLSKSFSQWDQNGDGALDAAELGAAFGQLARPDLN